jgi:hypothetical protein
VYAAPDQIDQVDFALKAAVIVLDYYQLFEINFLSFYLHMTNIWVEYQTVFTDTKTKSTISTVLIRDL